MGADDSTHLAIHHVEHSLFFGSGGGMEIYYHYRSLGLGLGHQVGKHKEWIVQMGAVESGVTQNVDDSNLFITARVYTPAPSRTAERIIHWPQMPWCLGKMLNYVFLEKDFLSRGEYVNTQLAQDPLEYWNSGLKEEIIRHAPEDVLCMLHTHAGFLDRDLYRLSSFSAVRPMEAGFLCSEEMRSFVRDYNIELVNYSYFD